ncbi:MULTISPECIES: inorganic phosphate transporter [Halorubrum]|jgi:PiT family inorganic phosphate transporter|uniref:Phosphate transporter n=1 Tax=Halorubrum tropicale TaxID=1765655 RepID=A0A0N0BSC8_9EURY|nr:MULTISPECIES: inorganic phosphate transporter [Halorubrum]KOX98143.1 anion permease [Halorubrum tropicale]RLM50678.1 inorganic phosphate transporter [Halorubrum sp. Atlit-28R]TKX42646.1 inorganic phosphate transporter [Halorubrum sp. ARQ200]TKX51343.1 inorganic phosphate transporter [Halorubrum sp. ASP121]TKX58727.1 inorganic phosphate transporter [Halorubrum sp. ASP1]
MVEPLLLVGVAVAAFVGYNIGGATTGPAFGPAVGADVISKAGAAALMSLFFFVGAGTLGQRVVTTLGEDLVTGANVFTLETSIIVLFFIGGALFVGNFAGVPASTSMTAVGAIAGLGIATNTLDWAVMGEIAIWWLVAPIIGFWVSGVVGRYFYSAIDRWVAIESTEGALFELDRSGLIPRPVLGPNTTRRELTGGVVVISIGCLMAFSSGTSNIANAIAPLVALDGVEMTPMILLGSAAVAVGAFTIARRTLDTLGNDITDLPLTAAIVVAVVSSGIVISLSAVGIPASFVIIATMSIVGLGWGRATRTVTVRQGISGEKEPAVSVGALAADEMPEIGEGDASDVPSASDLFNPGTSARVVLMQNVVPILSTVGALVTFAVLFRLVW